ncbi:hypothetical protein D3C73_835580 [compost metagenome]
MGQPKRIRDLQGCSGSRIAASRQNVDDHRGRADAVIERFLTSRFDGRQSVNGHACKDGDHLPITIVGVLQPFADLLHCGWQCPVSEWSAVAQRAGFASQNRDIMPGIVGGLAAAEAALVLADIDSILLDDDPVRIGMHLDGTADGSRQDRVFVVVEADRAGLRHRGRNTVEAIKWPDITHEANALGLEHLPDGLSRLFGMAMSLGIGNAFVEQPGIQFLQALDPQARREEALAHKADLVLDLSFLPTGCGRAGNRLDKIVTAHLHEAAIVEPFLADKHGLHRRLHVVIDAARAGAVEEGESLVMRVKHHLLALTHIGPREHHPTVAEPDMGDLHGRRHPVDQDDLVAPVELIGLAGCIVERNVSLGCDRSACLGPGPGVTTDSIVATIIAKRPDLLVNPDQCQPFARRLAFVRNQEPLDITSPGSDPGQRLTLALIGKLRDIGADNLADRVPRNIQLSGDLLYRPTLNMEGSPDTRNRIHSLQLPTPSAQKQDGPMKSGRGQNWISITPPMGSTFHA